MVAFLADDGTAVDLHPLLVDAVKRNAHLQAELTAELIDHLLEQFRREGHEFPSAGFPPAFLLELGALAQLKLWEMQGIRPHLPATVPTCKDASADLYRRTIADPQQFQFIESATLAPVVSQVWLSHVSWDAPTIFQADFVVGDIDEDLLVEALVPLLWAYRHKVGDGEDKLSETC